MSKIYNIRKIGAIALLSSLCVPVTIAQEAREHANHNHEGEACCADCNHSALSPEGYSSASLELLKERRLWFHSTNAAGAIFDNKQNYSEVKIGYDRESGNYHRPQQGQLVINAGVDCEGFMNLGNALVWGEFSFKQRNIDKAGFNASISDPYRGMPFFIADEHLSDWRNQYYNMKFRASTPLYWGKVAFGVEGKYRADLAAKQLDPRVDTRYFELGVNPSVAYSIDRHNSIGVVFEYTALKEDSRMESVNMSDPQNVYWLNGLGTAIKEIVAYDLPRTDYHGHILGGGLQYNFRKGGFNLLATVDFTRHIENMDKNPQVPEKKSSVRNDLWKYSVLFRYHGKSWSHHFNFEGIERNNHGIQYINEFNNSETNPGWKVLDHSVRSTYKTTAFNVDYSLIRNRADEYAWRVDAGISYQYQRDEYLLPDAHKSYKNIYSHLTAKYNAALGAKYNRRLLIAANGGFNHNIDGKYTYNASNPDFPTVTQLETGEIQYFSSNFWNLGASVSYSQQIKESNRMNAYARAEFNYVKTHSYDFNNRRYMAFAIGVTF